MLLHTDFDISTDNCNGCEPCSCLQNRILHSTWTRELYRINLDENYTCQSHHFVCNITMPMHVKTNPARWNDVIYCKQFGIGSPGHSPNPLFGRLIFWHLAFRKKTLIFWKTTLSNSPNPKKIKSSLVFKCSHVEPRLDSIVSPLGSTHLCLREARYKHGSIGRHHRPQVGWHGWSFSRFQVGQPFRNPGHSFANSVNLNHNECMIQHDPLIRYNPIRYSCNSKWIHLHQMHTPFSHYETFAASNRSQTLRMNYLQEKNLKESPT